jgi:predicted DCC family thiol-disulfide oxidoreductase YuxK
MHHLVLYDGVCGLCNGFVQFIIARDPQGVFQFASLQSDLAARTLRIHGRDANELNTVVVIAYFGAVDATLLDKSTAALFVLYELGGFWRWLSGLRLLATPLRDWLYDRIAAHRYRVFGKHETCLLPSPEVRSRFLDL